MSNQIYEIIGVERKGGTLPMDYDHLGMRVMFTDKYPLQIGRSAILVYADDPEKCTATSPVEKIDGSPPDNISFRTRNTRYDLRRVL